MVGSVCVMPNTEKCPFYMNGSDLVQGRDQKLRKDENFMYQVPCMTTRQKTY